VSAPVVARVERRPRHRLATAAPEGAVVCPCGREPRAVGTQPRSGRCAPMSTRTTRAHAMRRRSRMTNRLRVAAHATAAVVVATFRHARETSARERASELVAYRDRTVDVRASHHCERDATSLDATGRARRDCQTVCTTVVSNTRQCCDVHRTMRVSQNIYFGCRTRTQPVQLCNSTRAAFFCSLTLCESRFSTTRETAGQRVVCARDARRARVVGALCRVRGDRSGSRSGHVSDDQSGYGGACYVPRPSRWVSHDAVVTGAQ
jgi:hypothetical protein